MDLNTKNYPLDEKIRQCLKDSPDIVRRVAKRSPAKGSTVELVTELPAVNDVDILIGMAMRWREIADMFDCKLRVYAWCYTDEVEKWILQCVQNSSKIFVTVLPMTLKKG